MSKLFQNKMLLFSAFLAMAVLATVFFSYTNARSTYRKMNSSCQMKNSGEMPWESISRHFVTAVFFR